MTQIIGLVGFKQVGKSTAAKYLEEKYGFVRHDFKDALVAEIKNNFPLLLEDLAVLYDMTVNELFEKKPKAMRSLLQNYGTEVRRRYDADYWVRKWTNAWHYLSDMGGYEKFVTDDVRFLNEAQAVKELNGIIIRLTRPDLLTGGDHSSETEQLQIEADYTIECEAGDFDHLYRELDEIVENPKSQ